ncbi:hypothetical protein [Salinibius halmophilus]|uniref:hypothetical protein n=1 Tax=Salinibius halmophilus TaxID=1853216 RepID=UPI000E66540F|nr:hypothetical protein [Salinibius halmophilus]
MKKLLLAAAIATLTAGAYADDHKEEKSHDDDDCSVTINFPKGGEESDDDEYEEFEWWDDHSTDFYYGNINTGYMWQDGQNFSYIGVSALLGDSIYVQAEANTATDTQTTDQSDGTRFGIGARFDLAESVAMHILWDNHRFKESSNYWGISSGLVATGLNDMFFVAGNARANLTLPDTTFSGELEAGIRPEDWIALSGVANFTDSEQSYGIRGRLNF